MPNFIENLGLGFLTETENSAANFMALTAQEGENIIGYYVCPYINKYYGDAQFILRTNLDTAEKMIEIVGMDTHCDGQCVWETRLLGLTTIAKDLDKTERQVVLRRKDDGSGVAVVNIVNADVLPSFLEDDIIKLQMIAFPVQIGYYANEDEYTNAQEAGRRGRKWLLADGAMVASGFMFNHAPERSEEEKNYDLEDHMLIRGTVKELYYGTLLFGENESKGFIRCIIGTHFGDLEIVHTMEQVPKEQQANLKIGSIVSGIFVLSGDAAIFEYEKGIIRDAEHNLRLLRYIFLKGEAERIRYVLDENSTYYIENSGEELQGRDDIIEFLSNLSSNYSETPFAYMATILSVEADEAGSLPEYGAGTRCIVKASGDSENYTGLIFIDVTDTGHIERIHVTADYRYIFDLDETFEPKIPFSEAKAPDSVFEPIILRAKFLEFIDDDLDDCDIIHNIPDYRQLEQNAQQLIDGLNILTLPDNEKILANIFGYLFAKSIESFELSTNQASTHIRTYADYSKEDAFKGQIRTVFDSAWHKSIEEAMLSGKQFYKDFYFFIKNKYGEPDEETYRAEMLKAMVLTQKIGQLYAEVGGLGA